VNGQKHKHAPLALIDATRLHTLLRHLRDVHRIKFKDFARYAGLDCDFIYKIAEGRAKGTRAILDTVLKYYDDNKIPPPEISLASASETSQDRVEKALGLNHILDQLHLNTDRVSSSKRLIGNYLLFSDIGDKSATVTWIELKKPTAQIPIPFFTALRPAESARLAIFQGFYYEHMTTLFLFGHFARTPLGRSLFLVPAGPGHHRHDWHGVIAGAYPGQSLFTSRCFLKWIGKDVAWLDHKEILGERQDKGHLGKYSRVLEFVQSLSNLTSAIARMGG
jgi:hypothetical protein